MTDASGEGWEWWTEEWGKRGETEITYISFISYRRIVSTTPSSSSEITEASKSTVWQSFREEGVLRRIKIVVKRPVVCLVAHSIFSPITTIKFVPEIRAPWIYFPVPYPNGESLSTKRILLENLQPVSKLLLGGKHTSEHFPGRGSIRDAGSLNQFFVQFKCAIRTGA